MILATSKLLIVLCLLKFFRKMKITFLLMNPLTRDVEWPLYVSTFSNVIKNRCLFFKIYINQVTKLTIKSIGSIVEGYCKFKFLLLSMSGLWYFWGECPLHSPDAINSSRYAERRTVWKTQIPVIFFYEKGSCKITNFLMK